VKILLSCMVVASLGAGAYMSVRAYNLGASDGYKDGYRMGMCNTVRKLADGRPLTKDIVDVCQ
jgi:hypothetical protein